MSLKMTDSAALARQLAELDKVATPGPWYVMDKLAPSLSDHGYRRIGELTRGRTVYAEAERMVQEGKGYVWGDDGPLIESLRNSLPAILRALCVMAAVDEWGSELCEARGERLTAKELVLERADELLADLGSKNA